MTAKHLPQIYNLGLSDNGRQTQMVLADGSDTLTLTLGGNASPLGDTENKNLTGTWEDDSANEYVFEDDGKLEYRELVVGSALTISAFETILGEPGGWLVCIAIALFAFSTISWMGVSRRKGI